MYETDKKCQKCKNNGKAICNRCDMYYDEFDPVDEPKQTNADRIRAMSDEELAERFFLFLCVHVLDDKVICKDDGCKKCWMRWLREEVKE